MIGFCLGGLLSMAIMTTAGAYSEGKSIGAADVVAALFWPLTIAAFVYDVARGWRS